MKHIDEAYADVVTTVLSEGTRKENRTGVDTISTFGVHYNVDLQDGFPLLTTKQIAWKNIVVEMLWFLSGSTNIEILKRHGCKFWDAWADKNGEVSSAYGAFWRKFPVHATNANITAGTQVEFNDQIAWIIDELKRNPMSRRLVVSAWAPQNAQSSKLPPCHCLFVFNVQNVVVEKGTEQCLCLHLTQRSCDVALGVPYNIASYALLMHIVARLTGLKVGVFSHTLVDAHIYTASADGSKADHDHIPGLLEQIKREPRALPTLQISEGIQTLADIEALMDPKVGIEQILESFGIVGYDPHPAIAFKVAV